MTIQHKLDRLDEAFLFERSIDIETSDRHAQKLREELTLARIVRRSGEVEELDVEGILALAERVLPRAADLWVQASVEQRQRFRQLFFPDGIAFDGNRFSLTGGRSGSGRDRRRRKMCPVAMLPFSCPSGAATSHKSRQTAAHGETWRTPDFSPHEAQCSHHQQRPAKHG